MISQGFLIFIYLIFQVQGGLALRLFLTQAAKSQNTGPFLRNLRNELNRFAVQVNAPSEADYIVMFGDEVEKSSNVLAEVRQRSIPLILMQATVEQKSLVSARLSLPIISTSMDSEVWLVDSFMDPKNHQHFRFINVPSGSKNASLSTAIATQESVKARLDRAPMDAKVLDKLSIKAQEPINEIVEYVAKCSGQWSELRKAETCWNYLVKKFPRLGVNFGAKLLKSDTSMIPEDGAVWREMIETSFRLWEVQWSDPFPFHDVQRVEHRLNVYWYLYVQAPPFSQLYYAIMMVDTMGLYLSNLELEVSASREDGQGDPENLFWIKSSPQTQNTQHRQDRSWSSTDSYSLSMNLGFKGELVYGDLSFNYTHTFTASYSESREITDWSVIETTDPVASTGRWHYFQQWPVDIVENFPQNWEQFYEQSWNPCRVREVPNLSRYALTSHNSMVWGINPKLRSSDGRRLPIKFSVKLSPKLTAHTCENYDGHHKMRQSYLTFDGMDWLINVADLNNIQYHD